MPSNKDEKENDTIAVLKQRFGFRSMYDSLVTRKSRPQDSQIDYVKPKLPFDRYAAASTYLQQNNQLKTVLDRPQQEMCANVWANDGPVRRAINELIFNIQGERVKYAAGVNDEFTETLPMAKLLIKQKEVFGEEDSQLIKLKQRLFRANKRCEFTPNTTKGIKKCFVYGRSGLEIIRFDKNQDFNQFGEPQALVPLYSTRIVGANRTPKSKEFDGFIYDDPEENDGTTRLIKAQDLIPFFHDDDGIFENTDFSGISMIWPLLSVSQSNEVINDEDLPASVRQLWAKMGHLYTGDNKDSTTNEIMKKWLAGSILIHHKKELKMEVHDLARDLMEIINVRKGNVEFILWCIGLPAFLLLSNVANFATANTEAQVFKAGVLNYYRESWLRGIYEHYWYDPQLADFIDKPIDQVIASDWKVKAVFEDIVYETKLEQVQREKLMVEMGAHDEEDVLEALGEDDLLEKKRQLDKVIDQETADSVDEEAERREREGLPPFGTRPIRTADDEEDEGVIE